MQIEWPAFYFGIAASKIINCVYYEKTSFRDIGVYDIIRTMMVKYLPNVR